MASKNKVVLGYYPTKKDALEALAAYARKTVDDRFNMTFAEVYESWKKEHFRTLSKDGVSVYEHAYKSCKTVEKRKIRELRTDDFQQIIDKQVSEGKARSTVEKTRLLAGQLCKWAIREEIITVNYSEYVKLPKQAKKEKEIFSDREIDVLFANDADDTVKLILVMIFTGLRIGELMTVERGKVNLEVGYMMAGIKTEAGRDRIIPISEKVLPYVRYFLDRAPNDGLLMEGYDGNRSVQNFRKRDFYPALEKLGIKGKTPHSTRHTFASMMAKANVKPEILQKIIGHAKYSTTAEIYIHADIDSLRAAIGKI